MITQTVESIVKGKAIQEVVRVPASATVADAVAAMTRREMGSVLVGAPGGAIEGIFTERDVMRRVVGEGRDPKTTKVSAVMSPNVRHVQATATVEEALRLMVVHGYRHLLVDRNGTIEGLISIRDLMCALVLPDAPIAAEGRVGVIRARAEETIHDLEGMKTKP
jgi:CBS domain-containing protein